MKSLLLLRHGKSSWEEKDLPDHDRPLKARGREDAPQMGRVLQDANLVPDLIISSTAKRARETAEHVAAACGYADEIVLEPSLYRTGPLEHLRVLRALDPAYRRVLLVGHNPDLEELLETLTGQSESLPTAALAHIELPIDDWRDTKAHNGGTLIDLWTPKAL